MAEQVLRTVGRQNRQANAVVETPSVTWPANVNWVRLDFDLSDSDQNDPTSVVTLEFEASLDNGATWIPWGSATTQGSALRNPATEHPSITIRRVPQAGGLVRGRLRVGPTPVQCGFIITVDI